MSNNSSPEKDGGAERAALWLALASLGGAIGSVTFEEGLAEICNAIFILCGIGALCLIMCALVEMIFSRFDPPVVTPDTRPDVPFKTQTAEPEPPAEQPTLQPNAPDDSEAAPDMPTRIRDLQRQLDELRAQQERTIAESKREPIRPSSVQSEPQQPKRSEVHHYYHRRSSGGCFSGFFIFLIILIVAFSNLYTSDSGTQQKKSASNSTASTPRATAAAKPKNIAPGIDGSNAYDVVGSLREMGIKCERSDSPTGYSWTVSDMSDGVMSTIDIISNKDYEICLISFSMMNGDNGLMYFASTLPFEASDKKLLEEFVKSDEEKSITVGDSIWKICPVENGVLLDISDIEYNQWVKDNLM